MINDYLLYKTSWSWSDCARCSFKCQLFFFFEFGIKGPKDVGLGLQPLKHLLALALTPQNIFRAKEYVHLSEKNVEKKNDFG